MEIIKNSDSSADDLCPALFECFTIILCGYTAGRLNLVSQAETKGIGTFVGTFALPSLIFLSLARLNFTTVNWTFLLAILIAKGTIFFLVIFVCLLVTKPVHFGRAGLFAIFCTQSNDFALGFPIITAVFSVKHPEYASYLYLMAPISLAILNPIAFVLMEIGRQGENINNEVDDQGKNLCCNYKILRQMFKGIILNPVLLMTVLGILGNILFKHVVPMYLEGLLEAFGQAFSASALFLLGLRMVGQIHRLRGKAIVLPFVLIIVKLIILPVVMRGCVSTLHPGTNESDTLSLSTYAFLYGTIPTAPAVFVFSNQYQLEMDLIASSMVICTFLSAPIMFISAKMISINKDYTDELKRFGFDVSIICMFALIWVFVVFIFTKKYKRMPHRLTLCLISTQILLAVSVIWGGQNPGYTPSWHGVIQQALRIFSMFSCLLWTSMLAVGLLLLQSRGPCFVVSVWPVLGFVAWGAPAVMVVILLATKAETGDLDGKPTDAIRMCLLVFNLIVTLGSLLLYMRFRRRNQQYATLSAEIANTSSPPDESSLLVENMEPASQSQSMSINGEIGEGCYGTITATPSPSKSINCCTNDPNCLMDSNKGNTFNRDIEDIGNSIRECACPPSIGNKCDSSMSGPCPYLEELERATGNLGLIPPEQTHGRGGQLLKHTVLIIVYSLNIFIGLTYTTWCMMMNDDTGVFVEIQFLDIAGNYGQGLVMFILFGLDPEEFIIPAVRFFKKKWYGAETPVLPPVENLSFETKHVCDQFITHHLDRCRQAIAKDTRWRMRTYHNVFRGSCLIKWLINCGLAKDEVEAEQYGRHLLDGRLIAHVANAHHFTNSPLLYTFV